MSLLAGSSTVPDTRGDQRSNVFLAAVLVLAGSKFPVRIRNLSSSGALVDGRDLPDPGSAVRLQRGPYSVVATVVWRDELVCGLRFASAVPVQQWIAYGSGHSGQRCVDEIIANVRARGAPAGDMAEGAKRPTAIDRIKAAEQLRIVADRLEEVAAKFAAIPEVVEQGMAGLQTLDVARQKLVDLSTRIGLGER